MITHTAAILKNKTILALPGIFYHGCLGHFLEEKGQIVHWGFLNDKGDYLDRYEAFEIAKENNQIVHKHPHPNHKFLFSEDIWIEERSKDPRFPLENIKETCKPFLKTIKLSSEKFDKLITKPNP